MNERSLRILEFNKIKERIKKYARTNAGKAMVDALEPYDNVYEINNKLEETNEALEVLINKGNPPLEGLSDAQECIERAKKGGTLTPEQLASCSFRSCTMRTASRAKSRARWPNWK